MIEIQTIRFQAGYLPFMRQASLVAALRINADGTDNGALGRFDRTMAHLMPDYPPAAAEAGLDPLSVSERLIAAMETLLGMTGMPVFSHGYVKELSGPGVELVLPALDRDHSGIILAFRWMCDLINTGEDAARRQTLVQRFPALLSQLGKEAPQGMNPIRLLEAADRKDVPWRLVSERIYQFGWGSRARLFNSTLTDATPMIAVAAAGNKAATAHILREAGLPVPDHAEARDQLHALELAETLGYPVVIKPLAQAQGRGVAAGLNTPAAVKKAYKQADMYSRHILVEKHFEGNDYRLHVCNGEVYYASHRIPGGVTGDGKQTVEALLAQLNADPDRQEKGNRKKRHQIPLDDEARELLEAQGLRPQSVPPKGLFVKLRRIANVAAGGSSNRIEDLGVIHPDNIRLAVRAAAALRLDIAAIDFLCPDIRRSWMETGGIICEVNAQPQVGRAPLYDYLLHSVIGGDGRIPAILALGADRETPWVLKHAALLGEEGRTVGVSTLNAIIVGGRTVSNIPGNAYEGSLALMCDPDVDAAVICVPHPGMLDDGLAVDRFDVLVVSLPHQATEDGEMRQAWIRLASMLLPMCAGPVIIDDGLGLGSGVSAALGSDNCVIVPTDGIPALLTPDLPGKEG